MQPVINLTEQQFARWMRLQLDAWDAQACADYFGVALATFNSEYRNDPHFPRSSGSKRKALWDAEEVKRWRRRRIA